jgi:hypothetical protein
LAAHKAIWWIAEPTDARTEVSATWRIVISHLDISLVNDHRLLHNHAFLYVEMGRQRLYRQQKVENIHRIAFACILSEWGCNCESSSS